MRLLQTSHIFLSTMAKSVDSAGSDSLPFHSRHTSPPSIYYTTMNSHASAHEIPGVPNLFIDAFRGKYLAKTTDPSLSFVLTHYHGDHYGSLPRDNGYQGPAKIHCTPTTARL